MSNRDNQKKEMKKKADAAMKKTNDALSEDLAKLDAKTSITLDKLLPIVADPELCERLIAEVETATQQNENIGALKERLTKIGLSAVQIASVIAKLKGF